MQLAPLTPNDSNYQSYRILNQTPLTVFIVIDKIGQKEGQVAETGRGGLNRLGSGQNCLDNLLFSGI